MIGRGSSETALADGRAPAVLDDAELVRRLDDLCEDARFLAAHELARRHALFERVGSSSTARAAGRLAEHLGAPRLAHRLLARAIRLDPTSPRARFRYGVEVLRVRGPLAAWEWLGAYEPPESSDPEDAAHACWLRYSILAAFREFDAAGRWLARAESLAPDDRYHATLRVDWLAAQDRYDEALAHAREALERDPYHRSTIQSLAHLLQLHGRFEEAVELLGQKAPHLESGYLHLERARLLVEVGRHAEALEPLAQAEHAFALLEAEPRRAISGLRSEVAYRLGDDALAIREAERVPHPFFEGFAARLAARPTGSRVLLRVPFVRQHHLTCVPAVLTTLARYWGRGAEQIEITERICYAGTSSHSERSWAEREGWATREFTITWDGARALLDRGIPFVVHTVGATSGHAQAVIGYDERRETLFLRDPYVPATLESIASSFLEAYAAHGPRGLALVPAERAELLAGVDLADAGLYDLAEAVEASLERHDRASAAQAAERIEQRAPGHRIARLARRAIGSYDANAFAVRDAIEALRVDHPSDPMLLVAYLAALRQTAAPAQYVARLEELCAGREANPVVREMLAAEHASDGRRAREAERSLRRLARSMHDRATTVGLVANAAWTALDRPRALELYRFAASLDPTDDHWAQAYFRASYVQGAPEPAIAYLRERSERYLRRSSKPALALFSALESIDRAGEAYEALERACAARPGDGELLCFAAAALARRAEPRRAEELLAAAERCSPRPAWLRAASRVAASAGDHERAIELLRDAAEAEPTSVETHGALAARLAATRGPARAREHLDAACARFPENAALLEARIEYLRGEDPREHEAAVRRLLELEPASAWARRELALAAARLGRHAEAEAEHAAARELAPHELSTALTGCQIARDAGDRERALRCAREALELSPDANFAIEVLLESLERPEQRAAELEALLARLLEASAGLDGFGAWSEAARVHLEPPRASQALDEAVARRPDAWWSWRCRARARRFAGDVAGAAADIAELERRFPLLPGTWVEAARVRAEQADAPGEVAALERAVALQPAFTQAVLLLAEARRRTGDREGELAALERGLRHQPLEVPLLVAHAEALHRLDRRDDALAAVRRAIEADPSAEEPWSRLLEWDARGELDALESARALAAKRTWDVQLLLQVARLESRADPRRALATLERAIALEPGSVDAHDLRAAIAARAGDRTLAEAACEPEALRARPPLRLRGRKAWVAAEFGDRRRAIAEMDEIVRERPDYAFGHRCVADWAEALGDRTTNVRASRALVRLEPSSAASHGYLGAALADAGEREEALRSFARALELDPSYRYALQRSIALRLEARDHAGARAALGRCAPYVPPEDAAVLALEIAASARDAAATEVAARSLLACAAAPDAEVDRAARALVAGGRRAALALARRLALEPGSSRSAGRLWARVRLPGGAMPWELAIARVARASREAAAGALDVVVEDLERRGRGIAVLVLALSQRRITRTDDALWAAVGHALTATGHRVSTALWLSDHARRRTEPWVLVNLVVALRDLGWGRAGARVSRRALELEEDHGSPMHRSVLALDAAVGGRDDEAEALLARDEGRQPTEYYGNVRKLARAVVGLRRAPRERRREARRAALAALAVLAPTRLSSLVSLERIQWRRVARAIGRAGGSPWSLAVGYAGTAAAALVWTSILILLLTPGGMLLAWLSFVVGLVVALVRRTLRSLAR